MKQEKTGTHSGQKANWSMTHTKLVSTTVTHLVARATAVIIMLAGVLFISGMAGKSLNSYWGIGALLVLGIFSSLLYVKYIHNSTTIPEIIDGLIASLILYTVVVAFAAFALFIIMKTTVFIGSTGSVAALGVFGIVLFLLIHRVSSISSRVDGEV